MNYELPDKIVLCSLLQKSATLFFLCVSVVKKKTAWIPVPFYNGRDPRTAGMTKHRNGYFAGLFSRNDDFFNVL